MTKRCQWAGDDELMIKYHDQEWGVPLYDDRKLFEFLVLESAQAGLSWSTILNKRENYRQAFDKFDYKKIATYTNRDIARLVKNKGIIRNRLKITATIYNAKNFIKIQKEFGSFAEYLWSFVGNKQIINKFKEISDIPTNTDISDKLSQDLKKRGFKFVGSTICYAFMQATGLVNDHEVSCPRHLACQKNNTIYE